MRAKARLTMTYKGKTKTIAEFAEEYCVDYNVLKNRIKIGWSVVDAITKPIRIKRISSARRQAMRKFGETDFDRCIKAAIWSFKKEKFRNLKKDFEIHIPSYLQARWLNVA